MGAPVPEAAQGRATYRFVFQHDVLGPGLVASVLLAPAMQLEEFRKLERT